MDYYLHTASKYIIDKLLAHQINLLVIGHNQGWKQNINELSDRELVEEQVSNGRIMMDAVEKMNDNLRFITTVVAVNVVIVLTGIVFYVGTLFM